GQSACRRIDGKSGKAVDTELLEAQPLATLGHIQRIAADIVVYPPELDVGEGVSPVGRARQHDLIPGDVARLVTLVGYVQGPVGGDCRGRALVAEMDPVAHRDRARPGPTVVVGHGLHDVRRDVAGTVRALIEEGPGNVNVAPRAGGDPLLVVEEVVGGFVVDHNRGAPGGAAVVGSRDRDPARGAIRV